MSWKRIFDLFLPETSISYKSITSANNRVLIRPSGTEPVLRVMVEAAEPEIAEAMAQRLASRVGAAVHH